MLEQPLFSLAGTPEADLERVGGLNVAVDETFARAERIQLDDTSWVEHVQGWLAGDAELAQALMEQASWERRSRWMYTRTVIEPRLTAEYPVIADADPDRLAVGMMAALQGGYLLASTARDVRPMEIALDLALEHVRSYLTDPD